MNPDGGCAVLHLRHNSWKVLSYKPITP